MSTMSREFAAPRVRVVDDNLTIRQRVEALLPDDGYQAATVADGDTDPVMFAPRWWPATHAPINLFTTGSGVDAAGHTEALGAVGFLRHSVRAGAVDTRKTFVRKTFVHHHLPAQPVPAGERKQADDTG